MILFKHGEEQAKEFWLLSPKLQMILVDVAYYMKLKFKTDCVITSIIRDRGVHAFGRGVDVRTTTLEAEQIAKLDHYINDKYPYGKGTYKTFYYHKDETVDDAEYHAHLQCKYEPEIHKF